MRSTPEKDKIDSKRMRVEAMTDVHQSNDTIREFHLYLSDSKLQNVATTTARLHTLLAKKFDKKNNVGIFYDNGGGDFHQSNDTIREFHLHLSDSKLQNAATTTAHLHTLLAKAF